MRKLSKGMGVTMSDGWRGRVEQDHGDTVICIRNGVAPNDWLDGYRAFARRLMTTEGNKVIVKWKSRTSPVVWKSPASPVVDLEQARRDRERERLDREWSVKTMY